ncbi:serine/threonine-protein kinase [Streptomyces bambusae]|uniref:serine/threonine-protein kinase n=1 Tax=Streptomyces bambusae TaxID=1550616 RepID=UPI001CFDC861|nr:serine/threonine-protein kinase [Streptomyces bambusae]MCB5163270.1 serine/threonine-protein kinase [Streptomyces bambusae]
MSLAHAMEVPVGYLVGDWEVTEPIAAGSWGSVYAARHRGPAGGGSPAEAALKFLSTAGLAPRQARQLAESAQREVAFSQEASHPHLIRVYETIEVRDSDREELDGAVVLVMERAERSLLDLLHDAGGPTAGPVPDAGPLLTQICEALVHLHDSGWVHGDLKPGNVLLMPDGSVRLADFGLATRIEGTHGYGPPMGSPDYLPPERNTEPLSERGVAVRPSLDVWALGVTAHQLLSGGRLPFPGATAAARAAALHEYSTGRAELRLSPELPDCWRAIIEDCLAAETERKPRPTVQDLLPRFKAAVAAHPRARARRHRRRMLVTLVGTGTATAAVCGYVFALPHFSGTAGASGVDIRVYNVEKGCLGNTERLTNCRLGLARDPGKPYEVSNVLDQRVWHGDTLVADCVVYGATRIADEYGVGSTNWYRVKVPGGEGYGWLSAVRTRDVPAVPECERPA